MTKKNSKWESIADLIWETPTTLEGIFVAIPYLILNSIGTIIKVIFFIINSNFDLKQMEKIERILEQKILEK